MQMNNQFVQSVVNDVIEQLKNDQGTESYRYSVPIGISNRHIHLCLKDVETLFGKGYELKKIKDLKQKGEFACEEKLTIMTNKNGIERTIPNVRILGPIRSATQVEVAKTDARLLKINPPVRNSGDLDGSESVTLIGPKGQVTIEQGCILATRHIHLSPQDAMETGLKDGQIVEVALRGEKPGVIGQVYCKVKDSFVLELHLDTDDGNAFLVNDGDYAEILPK